MIRWGGKIPVTIHPVFWLMAVLIGFLNTQNLPGTAIWVVVIFVSVLLHEYGHALSGYAFGQRSTIELIALGGLTQRQGPDISLLQNFIVVICGPLAGFALCGLSYQLLSYVPEDQALLTYGLTVSTYVNLFWTILNLLPIQPLDGGKLLAIVFEGIFGFRGVRIALFISLAIAVTIGSAAFAYSLVIPGVIFMILAFENLRAWRGSMIMSAKDRDTELQDLLGFAEENMSQGNFHEAKQQLLHIRSQVKRGLLFIASTEMLAELHAEEGDRGAAYELLKPLEERLSPMGLRLLQQLAYETGHWRHATALGGRAYRSNPSTDTAVLNAQCHAVLGEVQPTIGWLRCALQEGLLDVQGVLHKVEFDHVRKDPTFQNFVDSLG